MKLKLIINNLSSRDKEVEFIAKMLLAKYKVKPMIKLPKRPSSKK